MQIQIVNGIYADQAADFRTAYPRNMVPVPKVQGISNGYLRPADGVEQTGAAIGPDRGGINWNGVLYRVSGTKLVRVSRAGAVQVLGDVGDGGHCSFDYSFDRLGIASGGRLYYWNGSTLTQVTDPDLRTVRDVCWIAGYFLTTDGDYLVTTDLGDPASVKTLNYGSAESDPDPIMAVDELRNEAYAFGRYTIEAFQNVGGTGFPFQRIEGAQVGRGIIGTHTYCEANGTFMFMGSGRDEAPGVFVMVPGDSNKISTREIDTILLGYTEEELSQAVMERRADKNHVHVLIHLPRQTLVYDLTGTQALGEPVWFTLDSGLVGPATYRARGLVWCYDQWNVGDPTGPALGRMVSDVSTHYGQPIGWEFGTQLVYNEAGGAIVHELELICLPGRVPFGEDPRIWTSYSTDGQTWSMERGVAAGRTGERNKRICWRTMGTIGQWRVQRFRGTSDAHVSVARLEAQLEPLMTKGAARV